ncbi:helix-turn-helix domain-containing protein [Streptomyces sp. NPDC058457]|uniref:helix-turn-helix domain-containing protein n=1 Tax=Streptomyces sp. NPDC058457 TaxID=3346507 RepID=UPI0036509F51
MLGRRLGAELLGLRTAAGRTQPQAAQALSASTAEVAKMEGGWVPVRDPDIRALCDLYDIHDPAIAARLARRCRLTDDRPLSLRAVIHEAVLRNFAGGSSTARAQLEELMVTADLPSVELRIFPFGAGTHPGLNGSFNILSFAAPGAMDVVYLDAHFTQHRVEGGEAAAAYDELCEKIAEHALDERESVSFLHKLRKEL